jgi:hypothetical protein
MRLIRLLLFACTVALCPAICAELPLIADAAHDPAWRELWAQLAPGKARESAFEERRYFPFRRDPVILTGEIRIMPDRGLSLHYLTPEQRVLIADAKGLLLRDAAGRSHSPPGDPRARAALAALVDVLRFDLPELQRSFVLRGRRDGDAWTLTFIARDRDLAAALGTLVLTGERARLCKIEMIRSANQRIEVLIGETHEDAVFTADELSRFFR